MIQMVYKVKLEDRTMPSRMRLPESKSPVRSMPWSFPVSVFYCS